jgi:hypothetical protein
MSTWEDTPLYLILVIYFLLSQCCRAVARSQMDPDPGYSDLALLTTPFTSSADPRSAMILNQESDLLPQKHPIHLAVSALLKRIPQLIQKLSQLAFLFLRTLNTSQHPPDIAAIIPIMEQ